MGKMNEMAATMNHNRNDCPARLDSRCVDYNKAASSFNQSSSKEKTIVGISKGDNMNEMIVQRNEDFALIEQVVMQGDLSKLNPEQRVMYYKKVCESSGLNPYTRPFDYIYLNGKLTLYAKKDCTEQLRRLNGISIEQLEDKIVDDLYIVKAKAKDRYGRTDESTGAVVIGNLKGEAKANAIMKAETKAKRRVTLSISGMGWTDETEIDSIPSAKTINIDLSTGEIKNDVPLISHKAQIAQKTQSDIEAEIETNKPRLKPEQVEELQMILDQCEESYRNWVYKFVFKTYKTKDLSGVPFDMYDRMKDAASKNMQKMVEKQGKIQPDMVNLEEIQ